jgi:hypothetical protein
MLIVKGSYRLVRLLWSCNVCRLFKRITKVLAEV